MSLPHLIHQRDSRLKFRAAGQQMDSKSSQDCCLPSSLIKFCNPASQNNMPTRTMRTRHTQRRGTTCAITQTRPTRSTKSSSTRASRQSPLTPSSSKRTLRTRNSRKQNLKNLQPKTALNAIIEQIEKRKVGRGYSNSPWQRFRLSPTDYQRLELKYQQDEFVREKIRYGSTRTARFTDLARYDYFPSDSLFVLRMPSSLHELVAAEVNAEIRQQLRVLAGRADSTCGFARRIKPTASADICFDNPKYSKHCPDGQFGHAEARYPGVVLEVSYSQKKKDLPRLADAYILGTRARIQVVVGLDIDYTGKSKRATLSVWRPQIQVNTADRKVFVAHKTVSDQVFYDPQICYSISSHLLGISG